MFMSAFLWCCLACTSHSLRPRSPSDSSHDMQDIAQARTTALGAQFSQARRKLHAEPARAPGALQALATLLTDFNPAAGLHKSKATGSPLTAGRIARAPRLQGAEVATAELEITSLATPNTTDPSVRVLPAGCPSCEADFMERSQEAQKADLDRRAELRTNNMSSFIDEIYEYAMRMNESMRQILMLKTDQELRSYMFNSSTGPTPLMEKVFNTTMLRVPYEVATFICGMDQGMLLRTLVSLSQPRRCLDIGSFTGYSTSSILEALPDNAKLIALDIDPDYTSLAEESLGHKKNVEFVVGPAIETMHRFEKERQQFDFISLDADKPMHAEYINASLRLLRPGGVLVMFGMILFPTPEDQDAMMELHESLPNDTRTATAQLPLGCGMQLMVKNDSAIPELSDARKLEQKRWQLESELAAIDRYMDAISKQSSSAN